MKCFARSEANWRLWELRGKGELARISDSDIRKAVRVDRDAALIASADWLRRARLVEPKPKKAVSIRLDEDMRDWFRR